LTASQLNTTLDNITCSEMFIFLGPCHSCSFINNLNETQNRAIYTSCGENETAYITNEEDHSLWPWGTIQALDPDHDASDADVNSDGKVSLDECEDHVYTYVYTALYGFEKSQTPELWIGTTIGDDGDEFIGDGEY
jgi:hypothetical protein